MKLALKCQFHQLQKYLALKRNSYVKLWKESDMNLDHKSKGEKIQLDDQEEESSSSEEEDDDDDDDEQGAFAMMPYNCSDEKKSKKWDHWWKSPNSDTKVALSLNSLPSRPFTPTSSS